LDLECFVLPANPASYDDGEFDGDEFDADQFDGKGD